MVTSQPPEANLSQHTSIVLEHWLGALPEINFSLLQQKVMPMTAIASRRSNWHRWAWFGAQIAPNLPTDLGLVMEREQAYSGIQSGITAASTRRLDQPCCSEMTTRRFSFIKYLDLHRKCV
jgi:hypothetical protein